MRGTGAITMSVAVIVMRLGRQGRGPISALTEEGHEHESPGIEGGQTGRDVGAYEPVDRPVPMRRKCRLDDCVLGNETGEADRREWNADASQGKCPDDHHPEGE